jgi:hypothetical protein
VRRWKFEFVFQYTKNIKKPTTFIKLYWLQRSAIRISGTDCKIQQVLRWIRGAGNVAGMGGGKVYENRRMDEAVWSVNLPV